jgi:hypothetical protein
VKNPKIIQIV